MGTATTRDSQPHSLTDGSLPTMTRAAQTISFALLVSSAYLLLALPLLTENSPIPSILPAKIQNEIVPVLPFWAVISLGAYLLGRLGLGVLTFNDTHDAYVELQTQIEQAKKDLSARKVGTD